jgi:hypothetical protein
MRLSSRETHPVNRGHHSSADHQTISEGKTVRGIEEEDQSRSTRQGTDIAKFPPSKHLEQFRSNSRQEKGSGMAPAASQILSVVGTRHRAYWKFEQPTVWPT